MVNSQGVLGYEVMSQKFESRSLAAANIENTQTNQVLQPGGFECCFKVELQLEDVVRSGLPCVALSEH